MTSSKIDRRTFVQTGASLCGMCLCAGVGTTVFGEEDEQQRIDPKKLNYCGYTCPKNCKWLKANETGDVELKKQAFEEWKIKERYGFDFDPATAFCRGCKSVDEPQGVVLSGCTVRACARKRKHDCCVECADLTTCEHDLWKRFPKFRDKVVEMQQRYVTQGGAVS